MTDPIRRPSKRTIILVLTSAVLAGLLIAGGTLALIGRDDGGGTAS
jgi:hypothetical protein